MTCHFNHDLFGHLLQGSRDIHFLLSELGFGLAGGVAKHRGKLVIGHRHAAQVVEILHVHSKGAVLLEVDKAVQDKVRVFGLPIRGQSHDLVFAAVDLEAKIISKR